LTFNIQVLLDNQQEEQRGPAPLRKCSHFCTTWRQQENGERKGEMQEPMAQRWIDTYT